MPLLIKCADLAHRHRGKATATVFSLSITIPLFFFTNAANLLDKDKNFKQWAIENGWWGERGVRVVIAWLAASAVLSLMTYVILSCIGRVINRPEAWSVARQQALVDKLRLYANEHSTVNVLMANHKHRPLAETLVSVFKLAGWQADLTNVPLEVYIHDQLFEGVTVKGFNAHLVEAVAKCLTEAGMPRIRPNVESHNLKANNPKVVWAENSIEVTIGHTDNAASKLASIPNS